MMRKNGTSSRAKLERRIVGAGIGWALRLALFLQRAGVSCRIYEAVPEMRPLGVGINILPHAAKAFAELGVDTATRKGVDIDGRSPCSSIASVSSSTASRSVATPATSTRNTPSIAASCKPCCSMRCASASARRGRHRLPVRGRWRRTGPKPSRTSKAP
jgi:hypothetical protein